MGFTDRTNEFLKFIERSNSQSSSKQKNQIYSTPFSKQSIKLVSRITNLHSRVQTLSSLVSKKTLFEDPSAEISALINVVKTELHILKKETEELSILKASLKTNNSRQAHEQIHRDTVMLVLNTLLADSTKLFSDCLTQRSQATKEQVRRVEDIGLSSGVTALRHRKRNGEELHLLQREDLQTVEIPIQGNSIMQTTSRRANISTTGQMVDRIESTISDISKMFHQLASIVSEQGEMLDRIDTTVYNSAARTSSASNFILKYQQAISSNRKFIIYCFASLLIFIVLFMLFYN